MPNQSDPLHLLRLPPEADWSSEETKRLTEELSNAYHRDEAASASREVESITEKVRVKNDQLKTVGQISSTSVTV